MNLSPFRPPAAVGGAMLAAVMPARDQRRLTARLVALGIEGGAVYDGLVALTAAASHATLISLDRRAARTYERCRVGVRLVAP